MLRATVFGNAEKDLIVTRESTCDPETDADRIVRFLGNDIPAQTSNEAVTRFIERFATAFSGTQLKKIAIEVARELQQRPS